MVPFLAQPSKVPFLALSWFSAPAFFSSVSRSFLCSFPRAPKKSSMWDEPLKNTRGILTITPPLKPPYKEGDRVEIKCGDGFITPFNPILTVVKNANTEKLEWDNPNIQCFLSAQSTLPYAGEGTRTLKTNISAPYPFGTSVSVTCLPRYFVTPESTATVINHSGHLVWDRHTLDCVPRNCATPSVIPHGNPINPIYLIDDTFYYSCEKGYRIDYQQLYTCNKHQEWDPPMITHECLPLKCPDTLTAPLHGQLDVTDHSLHSRANYSCDPGYQLLEGDSQRRCENTGEWSGKEGKCIPISIPKPVVVSPVSWILWVFLSILLVCFMWSCFEMGKMSGTRG